MARPRKRDLGLQGWEIGAQWLGNMWGKLAEDQNYSDRSVWADPVCGSVPVSGDKNVLFLEQGGHLSHGKFYDPILGRKGESREPFLDL